MTGLEHDLRAALHAEAAAIRVPERPALDRAVGEPGGAPERRWLIIAACVALVVGGGLVLAQREADLEPAPPVASVQTDSTAPTTDGAPAIDTTAPPIDTTAPPIAAAAPAAANGWLAVASLSGDDWQGLTLIRPGDENSRVRVPGSNSAEEPCPAWSPDGKQLMFGRVTSSTPGQISDETTFSDAEAVIVPVDADGTIGTERVIPLDGFDAHVCGLWASDGRWAAFSDPSGVWVVDTETSEIRRLPDLRPVDLEWRPGRDELTIAGDLSTTWDASPVYVYSVASGELHQLGTVEAAEITWSPDGSTLAYRRGEGESSELWLVDNDGTDQRLLVADTGDNNHGIGPVWSPTGDRIVYQRVCCGGERHEVVLVNVADGSETVTQLETDDGTRWWPYKVTWSPDGTMLVGNAWPNSGFSRLFVFPADSPEDLTVFADANAPAGFDTVHRWAFLQVWGRQPVRTATASVADDVSVTLAVPNGWSTKVADSVLKGDPDFGVVFGKDITRIYTDSCPSTMVDPPPGPTVDDFASAWALLPAFNATAPTDISVDGFVGKQLEFTVPGYDERDCPYGDFMLMGDDSGDGYWAQAPNAHHRLLILDVDGQRLVIVAFWYPDTSAADRAEIDQILASIRIG